MLKSYSKRGELIKWYLVQ